MNADVLTRGLDLRSPRDRQTFRNRLAKLHARTTTAELKDEVAKITGQFDPTMSRKIALGHIARHRLENLQVFDGAIQ